MARRAPRGVSLVQVVVVVGLITLAVGGATWALSGKLGPLFGTADTTLAGRDQREGQSHQQTQVTGRAASSDDPNAMMNSMQKNAQQNTQAASKASGTP